MRKLHDVIYTCLYLFRLISMNMLIKSDLLLEREREREREREITPGLRARNILKNISGKKILRFNLYHFIITSPYRIPACGVVRHAQKNIILTFLSTWLAYSNTRCRLLVCPSCCYKNLKTILSIYYTYENHIFLI
jgi:hypothetical protein